MQRLVKQLEALLLVAGRPLSVVELAKTTDEPTEDVLTALEVLGESLNGRGIILVRTPGSAELASAPEQAEVIERFLQSEQATPLSKPALETLAIILHKQPTTRYEIEEIRGIASDQTIRNLLGRGLIEEAGRRSEPGRPMQYAVTTLLLRQLGVKDASEITEAEDAR